MVELVWYLDSCNKVEGRAKHQYAATTTLILGYKEFYESATHLSVFSEIQRMD